MPETRFLIIGGGNMASAIVEGALRAGFAPSRFIVVDPEPAKREAFGARGIVALERIADLASRRESGDQFLLAVKPQKLSDVCAELTKLGVSGIVISILAGTPTDRIRSALGAGARIIRAMPNTPARIGQGCTAIAIGSGASPPDASHARALFETVGSIVELPENLFDAYTALAGSGPAYLFLLAEAMARAGIDAGIPAEIADRATRQTLAGAAVLLTQAKESPEALRKAVTSPGGTTEAAISILQASGVAESVVRAVLAARDRGRALGEAT